MELIATSVITAISALLFAYWYRYTCLLILSAKTSRDYAGQVATANQLRFLEVQTQLQSESIPDLDHLQRLLDRDYALLTFLFRNANGAAKESRLEELMLQLNYRVMGAWCRVSRRFSPQAARNALEEMSNVVAYFANAVGERTACASAA
jgi:hypothetical protein